MRNERDEYIRQFAAFHEITIVLATSIVDSSMSRFRGMEVRHFTDRDVLQTGSRQDVVDPLQSSDSFDSFSEMLMSTINNNSPKKMKSLETEMKKRHLSSDERHSYHAPKSDWCESSKGEVCKSASSLDVSDLVTKVT